MVDVKLYVVEDNNVVAVEFIEAVMDNVEADFVVFGVFAHRCVTKVVTTPERWHRVRVYVLASNFTQFGTFSHYAIHNIFVTFTTWHSSVCFGHTIFFRINYYRLAILSWFLISSNLFEKEFNRLPAHVVRDVKDLVFLKGIQSFSTIAFGTTLTGRIKRTNIS